MSDLWSQDPAPTAGTGSPDEGLGREGQRGLVARQSRWVRKVRARLKSIYQTWGKWGLDIYDDVAEQISYAWS